MQLASPYRLALLSSLNRLCERRPLCDTVKPRSRWSSSTASTDAPQSRTKGTNAALLAFTAGSILSSAIAYYVASQWTGNAECNTAHVELNSQYGSPQDFKNAIEELLEVVPG